MLAPHDVHDAVAEVCPIDGMSFPVFEDKATWQVHYSDDATDEQKAAAQDVIDAIVLDPPHIVSALDSISTGKTINQILGVG